MAINQKYEYDSLIEYVKICIDQKMSINLKERKEKDLFDENKQHIFKYADYWLILKSYTRGICPDCCKFVGIDYIVRDHIYPKIKGGSNEPQNMLPLCFYCNEKKGSKIPTKEWVERIVYNLKLTMNLPNKLIKPKLSH